VKIFNSIKEDTVFGRIEENKDNWIFNSKSREFQVHFQYKSR
jgi:hypothetical protein